MNKMKKRFIFTSLAIGLLLVLAGVAFAAYTFIKNINVDNEVGWVTINNQEFLNYSKNSGSADRRLAKLRKDTVAIFDDIILLSDTDYAAATGTIQQGKTYYTRTGGAGTEQSPYTYEVATNAVVGQSASGFYERVITYYGINDASYTLYDSNGANIENSIITNNKSALTSTIAFTCDDITFTLVCTIASDVENGRISNINLTSTNSDGDYNPVIDADGHGVSILDKNAEDTYTTSTAVDTSISCSATENKLNNSSIYLSQLGFRFTFTTKIAVYVRVHIDDAWMRTRVYSSSTKSNYILKDQINGSSPFAVTDNDWYFDESDNYVYYKGIFEPQIVEGEYQPQSYIFNVNPGYYYAASNVTVYREFIDVDVSFTVDIVQANRALELWGKDPQTLV